MKRVFSLGDPVVFNLLSPEALGVDADFPYLTSDDPPAGTEQRTIPESIAAPNIPPLLTGAFWNFTPPMLDSLSSTNTPRLWLQPELPGWSVSGQEASGPIESLNTQKPLIAGTPSPNWALLLLGAVILWRWLR